MTDRAELEEAKRRALARLSVLQRLYGWAHTTRVPIVRYLALRFTSKHPKKGVNRR